MMQTLFPLEDISLANLTPAEPAPMTI